MKPVRRPWLIFGILLTCGIVAFTVSADWSAQSLLDRTAYVVSVIGVLAVLIYTFRRQPSGASFWGAFRWVFVGVVAAQVLVHATGTAKQLGYGVAGTVALVAVISVIIGWIFALQWIAMTRLSNEQ